MSDHRGLIGKRVTLVLTNGLRWGGVLRHIKPDGSFNLANSDGFVTNYPGNEIEDVVDDRGTCTACGDKVNNLFGDPQVCAYCERDRARPAQANYTPSEPCYDCGRIGALITPKSKVFRCPDCHAKNFSLTGMNIENRALDRIEAACKGKDVNDLTHRWVKVRGSRYRCRFCHTDRYTPPTKMSTRRRS